MTHPICCSCGAVKGTLRSPEVAGHAVCYCNDCRAFARFLGKSAEILDAQGGTHLIQTQPEHLQLFQGMEHLACMRLTDKGMLRWYTRCCNTPLGNTSPNFKLPYVGLVHSCLESEGVPVADAFGPVRLRVNTKDAIGPIKPKPTGAISIVRVMAAMLLARVCGRYKNTPFFSPATGAPVVVPKILSAAELQAVRGQAG